jgi:hypothetical protein
MAGLDPGPANPQPFSAPMSLAPSFDVIEISPGGRWQDRLRQLRQRFHDLNVIIPKFEQIHELSTTRILAEQRLTRLLDHQSAGGFHLKPDDPRITEQRRLVDKLNDDLRRLNELAEVRSAAWQSASLVMSACESWLRDGRPPGTMLEDHEVDVPKLAKGENGLLEQIENRRRRGRELRADLHRIRSAPFPSSYCKQRMREQVRELAMQGEPVVSDLIENDRKIVWPTQRVQSTVYNTEVPSIAFAALEAATPLLIWLHAEAVIKRLDAEIDAEADDKAALSHEARQQQEAEVMGDLLACERSEAALVWLGMEQKLPVEHRADCAPQAILQVQLVTAPRATNGQGTSPEHAYDIVGGRR